MVNRNYINMKSSTFNMSGSSNSITAYYRISSVKYTDGSTESDVIVSPYGTSSSFSTNNANLVKALTLNGTFTIAPFALTSPVTTPLVFYSCGYSQVELNEDDYILDNSLSNIVVSAGMTNSQIFITLTNNTSTIKKLNVIGIYMANGKTGAKTFLIYEYKIPEKNIEPGSSLVIKIGVKNQNE